MDRKKNHQQQSSSSSSSSHPPTDFDQNQFKTCPIFLKKIQKYPPPDLKNDRQLYIEWRLKPQVECYFRANARKLNRITGIVKTIQNILAGVSSGIAFIAARSRFVLSTSGGGGADTDGSPITKWINSKLSNIGVWGSVLTTIAAAIGTQFAAAKMNEVALELRTAANDIERKTLVMSSKNIKPGTAEWEEFILDCEDIIATANKSFKVLSGPSKKQKEIGKMKENKREWNPNATCRDDISGVSFSAEQRVMWLMDKKEYKREVAQERVMDEFPNEFSLLD